MVDKTLDFLLELNNTRYVIDERLGLWVKFEAKKVEKNLDNPHGIRYALSLHDRYNKRIMGFDNAHSIEYSGKKTVAPKRTRYHWHKDENDNGQPYAYTSAGQLVEDFWKEVDKVIKNLEAIK